MTAKINDSPIGIFDSGTGGLTVMAAVRRHLPGESIIYLGDTARLPYGTKSAETVIRCTRECVEFLMERGVKAIVVACNTASAYALPELSKHFNLPVLGVIEPGARAAISSTEKRIIGVIGTSGTIASNAYGRALKAIDPGVRVISLACPLFVPLAEEGWLDGEITTAVAEKYLSDMRKEGIDTLILGCTHYPLLKGVISKVMGERIKLVDSAVTTAEALGELLEKSDIASKRSSAELRLYVTDLPSRFEKIAGLFLGEEPPPVTRVDL